MNPRWAHHVDLRLLGVDRIPELRHNKPHQCSSRLSLVLPCVSVILQGSDALACSCDLLKDESFFSRRLTSVVPRRVSLPRPRSCARLRRCLRNTRVLQFGLYRGHMDSGDTARGVIPSLDGQRLQASGTTLFGRQAQAANDGGALRGRSSERAAAGTRFFFGFVGCWCHVKSRRVKFRWCFCCSVRDGGLRTGSVGTWFLAFYPGGMFGSFYLSRHHRALPIVLL